MASRNFSQGLKRNALTVALGFCFVGGVHAQSNTAGAVVGQAGAGDTITLSSPATGFSRTATVGADGNYRFSAVPIGQYTITRNASDGTTATREARVAVGTAANINFVSGAAAAGGGSGATNLDTVTVTGVQQINPIDVSSVESSTVLTAEQIARIPVSRDITAVALLAPGTVRGDAAFGNLASFGGASVAENQYYVNGFNITNSFAGLAFAQVPFEAIAEQQIKTGGYGAEFGRSLGGVINLITKRGTNDFHFGANVIWSPEELREDTKNVFYQRYDRGDTTPGNAAAREALIGTVREDNSQDSAWNATTAVWAGGPIIKDRLFFYAVGQFARNESENYGSIAGNRNNSNITRRPNGLVKLDWTINDSNALEFTAFSDTSKSRTQIFSNPVGLAGSTDRRDFIGNNFTERGGDNFVAKYTGYVTDNFTISALAGYGKFKRNQFLRGPTGVEVRYGGDITNPASGCPIITDARTAARRAITGTYNSTCNISGDSVGVEGAEDTRNQYRIDGEWSLGQHLLRFGVDVDNYSSVSGSSFEGGRQWRYTSANIGGVLTDIVREQRTDQGATVDVDQRAYYIEDSWSITPTFIANIGVRLDQFENKNGFGQTFVKIDDQIGPRLGFAWDVNGDSSFKVFGNAGRYALPLTPTVAIRGASASLFTRQNFRFTGVDSVTGAPIGLSPTGVASLDRLQFVNGEFGSPKDPNTIASTNLEPQYQDEYILGFQAALTQHLSLGVRGVYRDLKRAIDDTCDYRPFALYADANGLDLALPNAAFPYCRLFNPGEDVITPVDVDGDGTLETVEVAGNLLSPKAKRKYSALEFVLSGNWDKFFMNASYTYARSIGNTEGGVKSDIGQADTGTTQDFDYPELTDRTYGYLPNDRRHTLKLFGNYEITSELAVGGNFTVQSGRPKNCIGNDYYQPGDPNVAAYGDTFGFGEGDQKPYGAAYFRCSLINGDSAAGRGGAGRLPYTYGLDLSASYRPSFVEGLQFKADVFNVLNSQKTTSILETGEDATGLLTTDTYSIPTSYQAPRSVRLLVQYDF